MSEHGKKVSEGMLLYWKRKKENKAVDDKRTIDTEDEEPRDKLKLNDILDDLKLNINHFCYDKVRPNMTISEFEVLACEIMSLIVDSWDESE